MKSDDLKKLRAASGLTQRAAAAACGVSTGTYTSYERGGARIPEPFAKRAEKVLTSVQAVPAPSEKDQLLLALGEAVLIMTPEQREELYERAPRRIAADAASKAAWARIKGTLADALIERDRELARERDRADRMKRGIARAIHDKEISE
ncbi:helix-turn-helix transcriptional regulator [Collinsella sp. AGMB00827]|uniref:Helix-turn-helix transcriptional regulator n=1 Tax=Collinsella ureilytica TaxID=2869515 RepID=A0ABS7MI76_9ACTN|nr:helix-turn-helix transcriptional regulator [Collinsella urealyticum]MBY4796763.1 helix-turn-helix transcriptional regulator [Collinsella urealyticum]